MKLEELAYEAYRAHTGGISLASGQPIPDWASLRPEIQAAWDTSTAAVVTAITNRGCWENAHNPSDPDYPEPCGICDVRKNKMPENVRELVVRYAGR